jgi:hypothetical protein
MTTDRQAVEVHFELCRTSTLTGTQYISWLAEARKALVVGTANFIARDFDGWLDLLDLRRLLPLLGQVSLLELLGNHHSRWAGLAWTGCCAAAIASWPLHCSWGC